MRKQSEIKVTVRGKVIGGPDILVCLPLLAGEKSALLAQASESRALAPDLLEWRADGYDPVEEVAVAMETLAELRQAVGEIPLIFTCRIVPEGGVREIAPEKRLELLTRAMESGHVDIVDVEMESEPAFVAKVVETAGRCGVKVILSYHDFEKTEDEGFIRGRLTRAKEMGADIAKVALMPKDYDDVLTLFAATLKARTHDIEIPIVSISLGPLGSVTRVAGGLFGSDMTFAVGRVASAPGQIGVDKLRQAMDALYN